MKPPPDLYGLLAEFEQQDQLLNAARRAHAAGYRRMDAYSPFHIPGLVQALGLKRSRVARPFLAGGIGGALGGYGLLWYAMAVDWPMNVGGRPLHSWPLFIPITFEMAILASALAGFVATLVGSRFPMLYHPVFNVSQFSRASRDGFFLCIEASDPRFDEASTWHFLELLHPSSVAKVPK
ncbi:MAG: DUF3341 domain-containing protein [Verrucomicrobiota bacterium]